jgi:hypothetical protein
LKGLLLFFLLSLHFSTSKKFLIEKKLESGLSFILFAMMEEEEKKFYGVL